MFEQLEQINSQSTPAAEIFLQESPVEPETHSMQTLKLPSQVEERQSDFKVLKEISRGTMSIVYYCEGGIALKIMSEDANPDAVAIYQNDLQVLTDLGEHPNIVRLYETQDEATITHATTGSSERVQNCQVLEALHGGELSFHIARSGPFSKETSRGFLKQLISGIGVIHDAGYIHRDLKPWNIILSEDHSQVKVIDFGMATPIDKNRRTAPYTTYMPGTKQYMAPEVIVRPASERLSSDLSETDLSKVDSFALGVILINMLTGAYLFESCLEAEYRSLMNDKNLLLNTLGQKAPFMEEAELADLATFLQALLHEDSDRRLSIADLRK